MLSRLRPAVIDALLALVLLIGGQVEVWAGVVAGPRAVTIPTAILASVPLAWRRRFPLLAAGAPGLAIAIQSVAGILLTGVALLTALVVGVYSLARHREPRIAGLGGVLVLLLLLLGAPTSWSDYVFGVFLVAAPWLAGFAIRTRELRARALEERAAALEREREERTRAAIAEERARIARELHDVVAHHLSVSVIQLVAALEELDARADGTRLRRSLRLAEEACRQALTEMRRLLGVLRPGEDRAELSPSPGLAALDELVESVRETGLPLEVAIEGDPAPISAGLDLAAYRVVQEALTNALKHSGGAATRLALRYRPEAIEIEVVNVGRASPAEEGVSGRGLLGMRERVALYGGRLEAGPNEDGGFRVWAVLPIGETG
jgi:signal transduction histidine kinase